MKTPATRRTFLGTLATVTAGLFSDRAAVDDKARAVPFGKAS